MQLLAIVVNYRTAALTIEAVRSLLAALGQMPDARVIVVDNDSQDGSFEDLCRTIPAFDTDGRVTIVASPLNGGFGYGVNVGVRHGLSAPSPPSHFYLLNSDAFPAPSAVSELIAFFERHPQAGIAGSHIHGTDGEPHKTAFRFPSMLSEVERALRLGVASKVLARWRVPMPAPEGDCEVDWVAGASMLIRREVFEKIGLFDERFFLYFEETDFCRRAKLAGFSTHYVCSSKVAHVGSASTGLSDYKRRMPRYWFDSRRHYFRKNHGEAYLTATDLLFVLGFSLWRARRVVQGKPDLDPPSLLPDFIRHSLRARFA